MVAVLNDKRDEELARHSYTEDDNDGVHVQTEVSNGTDTRKRVDIAIHTPHLSIAIESKVMLLCTTICLIITKNS